MAKSATPPAKHGSRAQAGQRRAAGSGRSSRRGPGRWTLGARMALGIFALLVVVFFHKVALEGQTFVSPDTTAPLGFVRIGEQSLWKDHVYPLWNPYVFLGMPSFGSGAYNPLIYPPDWPLALIAKVVPLPDMTWMLIYYVLGGLFMFLLARELGSRPEGALLAGAVFVFAPNLVAVGSHGHGSQLVNSAYAPLLLWLVARWMNRGGLHHLGWLALAGGFQMLRGHAQVVFYSWLAIAIYVAVILVADLIAARAATRAGAADATSPGEPSAPARSEPVRPAHEMPIAAATGPGLGTRLVRAAGVIAAMVLAFGLAAIYNLPLRDYSRHSIRGGGEGGGVGMEYATSWSLGPWELPSVVIPGAVGFGGQTYWGGMPFTDYPNPFIGMVAAVAIVPAFLTRGAPQVFALLLAAFSILIAFGRYFPLYGWLYEFMPLFNKFRVPVMIVLLFQIATALGLAWGWSEALADGERKQRRGGKLALAVAILLALVMVAGVMGQASWRDGYVRAVMEHRPRWEAEYATLIYQSYVTDLGRACVMGLLACGLVLVARRRWVSPMLCTLALLGLLIVELWPVSTRVMEPVIGLPAANDPAGGREPIVDILEQAGPPGTFRALDLDDFQSNRLVTFGIPILGGYHAAKPRLYQDLIDAKVLDNLPWLRLLNARYIAIELPLDTPGMTRVYASARRNLYQFDALPRATVVGRYQVVTPARAIVDTIESDRHDVSTTTFLSEDPGLTLGPVDGATANMVSYGLHRVVVDVSTPGPALLRLADLWYPDWVATVDGRPEKILRADYLLRAVPVPAGSHRVEFVYRSAAVRRGLTLSLISLGLVLALLGAGAWQSRRRATRREPGPVATPDPAGEAA